MGKLKYYVSRCYIYHVKGITKSNTLGWIELFRGYSGVGSTSYKHHPSVRYNGITFAIFGFHLYPSDRWLRPRISKIFIKCSPKVPWVIRTITEFFQGALSSIYISNIKGHISPATISKSREKD